VWTIKGERVIGLPQQDHDVARSFRGLGEVVDEGALAGVGGAPTLAVWKAMYRPSSLTTGLGDLSPGWLLEWVSRSTLPLPPSASF
jgi:hypothetical protein